MASQPVHSNGHSNPGVLYDDYSYEDAIRNEEMVDDVCHEFEYSVLFFMVSFVVGASFVIYAIVLATKRRNNIYHGYDILHVLLFIAAVARFGVKINQALAIHGTGSVSQSGCKLSIYTSIGTAHVMSYLILALVMYAFWGIKTGEFASIDKKMRHHLGWIVLAVFAVEGATGMVPAIYMDVSTDQAYCNSTQTLSMSVESYAAAHILLQSILPYLLPFALMAYPLFQLLSEARLTSDPFEKDIIRNAIVISTSYIVIYTPLAVVTAIMFLVILSGAQINWKALCIVEGILRFLQDSWFIFATFVVVLGDEELGHNFPGKSWAKKVVNKIRGERVFTIAEETN